jgi:hypothetical protein
MEKVAKLSGNVQVGIAQKVKGWNVSTYRVTGNRVKYFADKDVRTWGQAEKEFGRQKSEYNKMHNMAKYGMLKKPSQPHKSSRSGAPKSVWSAWFG